ncbi:protein FAM53A isoform X2 [Dipodomys merriami]|uniref:protein FAM53A isoform X2 n=1 Tax=Dipodomys merriami TaxID=94247 RepID=UPI003855A4E6
MVTLITEKLQNQRLDDLSRRVLQAGPYSAEKLNRSGHLFPLEVGGCLGLGGERLPLSKGHRMAGRSHSHPASSPHSLLVLCTWNQIIESSSKELLWTLTTKSLSKEETRAPGQPCVEDRLLGALGLQALRALSCQPRVLWLMRTVSSGGQSRQAHAQARAALWTSVRIQGPPWHHRLSGTAGPCQSLRSWLAAAPRGGPAAPRSGLQCPRGAATAAGAPRCGAAVAAALGAWACPGAPPRPWRPGLPLPAAVGSRAARAAWPQLPAALSSLAGSPGAACRSPRNTLQIRVLTCFLPAAPQRPRPS